MSSIAHPTGLAQRSRRSAPRVTSACRTCKQRRSKCDGSRPKCSSCLENSRECGYEGTDFRKARHTTLEFNALNNRIAYLEQQLKSLQTTQKEEALGSPLSADAALDSIPSIHLVKVVQNGRLCDPSATENSERMGSPEDSGSSIQHSGILEISPWDALDSTDAWMDENPLWTSWDKDQISLVRDYLATKLPQLQIDQKNGKTFYVGPTSNLHLLNGSPVDSKVSAMTTLPTARILEEPKSLRAHENQLLEIFRTQIHPTFPILGDQCVLQLSQVVSQASSHSLLFYSILGAASFFAGEDSFSQWGYSRTDVLDIYTQKFRTQAGKELENCCFQNVKAFLLRAYLDALRGKLESATIFNSIACAMAKRLGLHVDCTAAEAQASISSPQQTRERLAIFWATLWFDRRLAILEGRACHIDHVDISSPRPLEQMKAKENYPDLPLSLELVYACQVEFYHLQDVTLIKLYAFSHASTKEDATSEGHLNYISWFSSLPNTMKDISNGKPFHPSFLSFHIGFHAGLILLHRTSLNDVGRGAELSNQRCRESAATITTLLKSYYGHFKESVADPMVLHAAFTAALVHLVLLLDPDTVTYRSSLKALRSTTRILSEFSHTSPYAANILTDLQEFATRWSILPANSPKFWTHAFSEGSDWESP